ncbi:MAG: hypothetical protein ABIG44_14490 [Planctomycetota bacterium]
MSSPEDNIADVPRPSSWKPRDKVGLICQVLLTALGLHMQLAVGFTLSWSGRPLLSWRHPVYGLVMILVGLVARLVLSPIYRQRWRRKFNLDKIRVRAYSEGAKHIPWRAAFVWIFLPALVLYQSNDRTIGSGDTVPMVQVALSIVTDGDLALDEFIDISDPPYYLTRIGDHYYSRFSLGPALLALPFVELARWSGGDLGDPTMRSRLEKVIASWVAAAGALLVFLMLLRATAIGPALSLTIFYVLASQNWSIASQALWQHGPVALCVAGILLIELHAYGRVRVLACVLQGLLLGLALGCRPTVVLLAVAVVVLVALRRPRQLPWLISATFLAFLPFALIHLSVYDNLLGPYGHAAASEKWGANIATALAGNLISPGRGLLIYQPLAALALVALWPRQGRRREWSLAVVLVSWCAAHLVVVSCYTHWWGGHAWGPRFLTELTPGLVVLMIPAVEWLWRWRVGRAVFMILLGWSIGLQVLGVYGQGAQRWMSNPVDIDMQPERLWDWSDPPFGYPWRDD